MFSPLLSQDLHSAQPKPRRQHGGTDRELQKREPLMLRESPRNPQPFFSSSSLRYQTLSNIMVGVAAATKVSDNRKQQEQHSEGRETTSAFGGAMGPNPVTPSSSLSSCCCGAVTEVSDLWLEDEKGEPHSPGTRYYQRDDREGRAQESDPINLFMNTWAHPISHPM